VALLFHGHTERANEARKEKLVPGAVHRRGENTPTKKPADLGRGEITPTRKPAERTREKVQSVAGVSEHKARQALRVVALDAGADEKGVKMLYPFQKGLPLSVSPGGGLATRGKG